jgi:hypothetical protein
MILRQEWSSTLGALAGHDSTNRTVTGWIPGELVYSTLPHLDRRGRHWFGIIVAVKNLSENGFEPVVSVLWSKMGPTPT